jgi:hypothetical protein
MWGVNWPRRLAGYKKLRLVLALRGGAPVAASNSRCGRTPVILNVTLHDLEVVDERA